MDQAGASGLPVWALVGPTGSGKTSLAIDLVEQGQVDGIAVEVLSADAMQLYRGMDIGTAKATPEEQRRVTHHLLDIWDPRDEASVEDYQRQARDQIVDCHGRGVIPLLVGGSGLYLSSVVYDFVFPGHDPDTRHRLESEFDQHGIEPLATRLRDADPEVAESIDLNNPRRVIRALEVMEITGELPSAGLQARGTWWHEPTVIVGLDAPREWLVSRIDQRVSTMWDEGLVEEVRALTQSGVGKTAAQAIGYREVIDLLEGSVTDQEARDLVAAHTKRYARKQMSWFRRDENIHWIDPSSPGALDQVVAHCRASMQSVRE